MFLIFKERKRRGGNPLNHARSPQASKPVTIRRGLPLHPLTDPPAQWSLNQALSPFTTQVQPAVPP